MSKISALNKRGVTEQGYNCERIENQIVNGTVLSGAFVKISDVKEVSAITATTDDIFGVVLRPHLNPTTMLNGTIVGTEVGNNEISILRKGAVYAKADEAFTSTALGQRVKVTATGGVVPGDSLTDGTEIHAIPLAVSETDGTNITVLIQIIQLS